LSLIGTKISRLKNLLFSGKTPNNEGIEDTLLDMAVYCVLLAAWWRKNKRDAEQKFAA
jgi:hypothetical protein